MLTRYGFVSVDSATIIMSDLDSFFAKKDKKKKTKKGFSKANTDILAKNLEENDRKEAKAEEKANAAAMATSEGFASKRRTRVSARHCTAISIRGSSMGSPIAKLKAGRPVGLASNGNDGLMHGLDIRAVELVDDVRLMGK